MKSSILFNVEAVALPYAVVASNTLPMNTFGAVMGRFSSEASAYAFAEILINERAFDFVSLDKGSESLCTFTRANS